MGDWHSMICALVIIEAAHLATARGMLQMSPFDQSPEAAAQSFVPMGSPTGHEPATHYWLSAMFRPEAWTAAQTACDALPWASCFEYSEPSFPALKRAGMGLQPLITSVP